MSNSSLYNSLFGGKKHRKEYFMKGGSILTNGIGINNLVTLLNDKKEFLIMVFSNLIVQLGITYYVMRNYNQTLSDNQKNKESFSQSFWLMIFELGIIILLALVPMPSWLKFILFSCFSYLFGITLSYLNTPSNTAIIQASIVGTISIFASMFLLGLILILFGVQLGLNVGLFLFFSLLALILFNIISVFMNAFSMTYKVITVIGMLLFSLYIVYDTNIIIQREYYGDFITASMDYYLDILNIFINFVTFYENN